MTAQPEHHWAPAVGPGPATNAPAEVFDPLGAAATRARSLSATLCQASGSKPSCSWYHGIWPYLRMVGMAAAPHRHQRFYLETLGALARDGAHSQVLVSGCADHSMLAHVVGAYRASNCPLAPTALDRCATPAALCAWYGELAGVPVRTEVADILLFSAGTPFDVVCTHSFFSQFPPEARPALVERWRSVLRVGGQVVTTTRITPEAGGGELRFAAPDVEAFSELVRHQAENLRPSLDIDPEELAAGARRYAELAVAYPTPSESDVIALFESSGFTLEHLEVRHVAGAGAGDRSGPGTSQAADYAEIVAVRG